METLAQLLGRLQEDQWRTSHPFEQSVAAATAELLRAEDRGAAEGILNRWLASNQPCIFGRSAARQGLLSHCVLFEKDLLQSDEHVRTLIQNARSEWTRGGFKGEKSGFVITAVAPRLVHARPDAALREFARRLCFLYLLDDIGDDQIYMDDLYLEAPTHLGRAWRWRAGVNYFAANGDGRWWQDHRIPGGIAFSVNSVGHMSRSGAITKMLAAGAGTLGLDATELPGAPVDSLDKALIIAMQTIAGASEARSGKATWLNPLAPDAPPARRCPVTFPAKIQTYDKCEYGGYYHTDITIPSEYFEDTAERPAHVRKHALDFTYLSDPSIDNPAYVTMGAGQVIKGGPVAHGESALRARGRADLVEIAQEPQLRSALAAG